MMDTKNHERYGVVGYQDITVPDITDKFFSFLAKERDNIESSFIAVIHGKGGTGKTTDALGIAYTMLKTDQRRFVAAKLGMFDIRIGRSEVDRRVRNITDFRDVHENDIVIIDEYISRDEHTKQNMRYLEQLVAFARHKRICLIIICSSDDGKPFTKWAHIDVTTIDTGVALVTSEYKRFMKRGVVTFSKSPLDIAFHEVYNTTESIILRPVIACAHCLGIVGKTDEKCGYCGYTFETTRLM